MPSSSAVPGFLGEYFTFDSSDNAGFSLSDIDWDATPVASNVVSSLGVNGYDPFWQGGPQDYFAARFTAEIAVEKAGRYTFYLTSDDGSQLSLDGRTVIDNDGLHGAELKTVTLDLTAGQHPLEVLYFEWRGRQTLSLDWAGPDTGGTRVALDSVVLPGSAPVEEDPATGGEAVGFLAEFFNFDPNKVSSGLLDEIDFSRAPDAQAVVDTLDYSGNDPFWQGGPLDYFAARFTAEIAVEKAGRYTFYLTSDDGSQLSLDDKTVIDHDGRHGAELKKVTLDLTAGQHPLEVLYFEWTGQQTLSLDWSGPDTGGARVKLDSGAVPDTGTGADVTGEAVGFLAEFFNFDPNKVSSGLLDEIDFSRAPDAQAVVDTLDYSGNDPFWQGGPQDYFAARFTAEIAVEKAGRYTFYLTSDDGSQLSLDGKTVIDHDGRHGAELKKVTLDLAAGQHPLEVLYFEWTGQQTLSLDWSGPDTGGARVKLDSGAVPGDASGTGGDQNPEPQPEPEPDPEPDTDTDMGTDTGTDSQTDGGTTAPNLPDRTSSDGSGTGPERLDPLKVTPGSLVGVAGGRTTTLELDTAKQIASVDIIGQPAQGKVSINPDNSIALVLSDSDFAGRLSFDYRVKYADGSSGTVTQKVDVAKVTQGAGWGLGEHYMLAEDAHGDIIVETGDNHRKVYLTEGGHGLTRAEIAAREGLGKAAITDEWLVEHSEYGGSENMALDTDVGMALWTVLTDEFAPPSSHWLLFERGHTYQSLGKVVARGSMGESELHPVHVTAWGDGAAPVIDSAMTISQTPTENVVISNLKLGIGMGVSTGNNVLVTDTEITGEIVNIRGTKNYTLHDSSISYTLVEQNNGEFWNGTTQGILAKAVDGILLEGNIFHHNAWEDDYRDDGSIEGGVSPTGLSHNVYMQWDTRDVTYRDNISSMAASNGAQFRGGAYVEDSLFTDNNIAVNMLGGDYKDFGHVGNFTYFAENVVTSGAYKEGVPGKGWGVENRGKQTTWLDNIVAHLADPDNPNELLEKDVTRHATASNVPIFFGNTKVLNWLGADPERWKDEALNRNLEGVNIEKAMQTTIQRFAAELTDGKTATIDGLMDYLLGLADTRFDDQISARDIVAYFQDGFGMSLDGPGASSHRFIPNDLASGMRWDNRVNWSNGETPGASDNVDLGGNRVHFGTLTTKLKNLDLGPEGELSVSSGKLTVSGTLQADGDWGRIDIDGAGQFWTAGYADSETLDIAVQGGRFANTGTFTGPSRVHVGDNAEAILATDQAKMVLTNGSELRVEGSKAKVGFDGDGSGAAVLQMADAATLSFVADAKGFSTLGEFRSGAWEQKGSPVQSGVSLDGTLQIDLSDYRGGTGTHNLVSVDALDGIFDRIEVHGLASKLNARTIIDYQADELVLEITSGNGNLSNGIQGTLGALSDENRALVDVLTAGEGGYDGGSPRTFLESAEISDLLF